MTNSTVRPGPKPLTAAQFWDRVAAPDRRGCRAWLGARSSTGYGNIRWQQRQRGTHAVAWELAYGPIPEGHLLRHKCDNRICCEPTHLLTGTHDDNMHDGVSRDRWLWGEEHPNSKLTVEDVRAARTRHAAGTSIRQLAREHGVDRKTMHYAVSGRTWARA